MTFRVTIDKQHEEYPEDPTGAGVVDIVYVRTSGSDSVGDGSVGNPYLTLGHALSERRRWPKRNTRYFDVTGLTIPANTFEFPAFESGRLDKVNVSAPTPALLIDTPINIFATPTVDFTIASPTIAADPVTGMITITDPLAAWTIDEHKGKFIQGANLFALQQGVIVSNTATQLVTTMPSVTAPVQVVTLGATFEHTSGSQGVVIDGVPCRITFSGIAFTTTVGVALKVYNCTANFIMCSIDGLRQSGFPRQIQNFYGCHLKTTLSSARVNPSSTRWNRCFFDGCKYEVEATSPSHSSFISCIFDGCQPIGNASPSGTQAGFSNFDMTKCLIENATSHGIKLQAAQNLFVSLTIVNDAAGDGVVCSGPGLFTLATLTGTGNAGHGLTAENGASVLVGSGVTVAGADDMKVGSNTARSWADFRSSAPINEEIDPFTFSRIAQP